MRKVIVFAVVCVVVVIGQRAAAQSTGSVAGTVTDISGAVLPGVTVEAASPALIEKVRTVVTDAAGAYKVEGLRPGTYTVTFTLAGFSAVKREGIELSTGFTATVNAELRVGSVEETITVSGAAPIVDVQNVTARTAFSSEVLNNVVMAKSTIGFAAVLLGASVSNGTQDVAGSSGDFPAQVSVHGNLPGDQVFTWDGLRNLTLSGGAGAGDQHWSYPNMLMVQEVTQETGNAPAQYETGGVHSNYVPKDGGNRFVGSAIATYSGPKLQSSNLSDTLIARGLTTEPSQIEKVYNVGVGVGGPVVRDRLWFYAGTHYWGSEFTVAGTYYNKTPGTGIYTPDLSRPGHASEEVNEPFAARMTWQATSKQKFAGSFGQQPTCLCGYLLGANYTPEAALNQHYKRNRTGQVAWTYVATSRLLFHGGVAASTTHTDNLPDPTTSPTTPTYTEFPRFLNYDNAFFSGTQDWSGQSAALTASYVTGSHAASVGFSWYGGNNIGDFLLAPAALPAELGVFRPTPTSVPVPFLILEQGRISTDSRLKANVGIFAQDQWKIHRVTANIGLRYDYLNAYARARCLAADLYTPGVCSPGIQDVPDWKDLNPRLGVAYDVFGDGRTAVKAALGRYVINEGAATAGANDPLSARSTSTSRSWSDTNGNYRPDCNLANPAANGECGAILNPLFGTLVPTTHYSPSYLHGFGKRTYSWQGQVSVQHELRSGLGVSAGYFRTSYGNLTVADNLNVTPADYTPFCLMVPTDPRLPNSGQQSCGWYDLTPAAQARGPNNLVRPASDFGDFTQVYNGFDFQVNARFGHGGLLSGGMSIGHTETNSCFVVDSPQQLNHCDIVLGWAAQRQVKFIGSYPLPWDAMISATFQHLPGIPDNAALTLAGDQALTQTTLGRPFSAASFTTTYPFVGIVQPDVPGTTDDLFTPNTKFEDALNQLDLRLIKDFKFAGTRRVRAVVDIGNVFNASPILALQTAYTPTGWLTPSSVLAPRIFKFGVMVDF